MIWGRCIVLSFPEARALEKTNARDFHPGVQDALQLL